jgi:hypothetical protein
MRLAHRAGEPDNGDLVTIAACGPLEVTPWRRGAFAPSRRIRRRMSLVRCRLSAFVVACLALAAACQGNNHFPMPLRNLRLPPLDWRPRRPQGPDRSSPTPADKGCVSIVRPFAMGRVDCGESTGQSGRPSDHSDVAFVSATPGLSIAGIVDGSLAVPGRRAGHPSGSSVRRPHCDAAR